MPEIACNGHANTYAQNQCRLVAFKKLSEQNSMEDLVGEHNIAPPPQVVRSKSPPLPLDTLNKTSTQLKQQPEKGEVEEVIAEIVDAVIKDNVAEIDSKVCNTINQKHSTQPFVADDRTLPGGQEVVAHPEGTVECRSSSNGIIERSRKEMRLKTGKPTDISHA